MSKKRQRPNIRPICENCGHDFCFCRTRRRRVKARLVRASPRPIWGNYRQGRATSGARNKYIEEVSDPGLLPKPRPPKPPRRDRRRPSRPR